MSADRLTATNPVNIAEIEIIIQAYNDGTNSKHREYAANKLMLMADDILKKLKPLK